MKTFEIIILFCLPLLGQVACAQNLITPPGYDEGTPKYSYYYKGALVTLKASKTFIAIEEKGASCAAFVKKNGLIRDPLSERRALKKRNLGLYRLSASKHKGASQIDLNAQLESYAETTGEVIQPVFEQGQALLIPSDEVIVGFKEDTSFAQAQEYLRPCQDRQAIIEVREHRKNTYILKINKASNGRAFQVCQFLSKLDKIKFAEPNFVTVMLSDLNSPE